MKKPVVKQIIMGAMALTLIGGTGVALISQNAFAATPTAPAASTTPATSAAPQKDNQENHSWEGLRGASDQLLTFLKLDKITFQTKSATETLAQIATDQGISRDALKAELTTELNIKLDKVKADFATNIDKTVDTIQKGDHGDRAGKKQEGAKIDLTGTAKLLGLSSAADLKAALVPGKSIADLATEKGVAVQSVIDLQVAQIMKNLDQNLADKKITQAQYDKQKANITKVVTNNVNDKQDDNNKQGDRAGKDHEGAKIDLSGTATLLGLSSAADLKAALVQGKSIADLATEKGVAVQSVIDLQVTQFIKNLDQNLADKKITQAQYVKQKANITKVVTNIVNDKRDDNNNQQDDNEVEDGATTPASK